MRRTNPAYVARHPIARHDYLVNAAMYARRGNDLKQSKLTPELVRYIRNNPDGKTDTELADELGVHYNTIYKVRSRQSWVHV